MTTFQKQQKHLFCIHSLVNESKDLTNDLLHLQNDTNDKFNNDPDNYQGLCNVEQLESHFRAIREILAKRKP